MITITITGQRNEGKTTTAARIIAMLRSLGMTVSYEGASRLEETLLNNEISAYCTIVAPHENREFRVVDQDVTDSGPETEHTA